MTASDWIALAGALSLGSLLTAGFNHLISRKGRQVDLAERSIRVADGMMTRMQAELERLQAALAQTQKDGEELRESAAMPAQGSEYNLVYSRMRLYLAQLTQAQAEIGRLQEELQDRPGGRRYTLHVGSVQRDAALVATRDEDYGANLGLGLGLGLGPRPRHDSNS